MTLVSGTRSGFHYFRQQPGRPDRSGKGLFPSQKLDSSVGSPIPLQWHWRNEGDWTLNGSVSVAKRVYDAVWRPGNSAEVQFYGMKYGDYQKHYDELWNQKYRIHLLNTYVQNKQVHYDAVWRAAEDSETQLYSLGLSDYQ